MSSLSKLMKRVLRCLWLLMPGSFFLEPRKPVETHPTDPTKDHFKRRRLKIALWTLVSVVLIVLLASSLALAQNDPEPSLLTYLAPIGLAFGLWRVVGAIWLYSTYRLAPWSYEAIRIWWRVTSTKRH